MDRPYSIDLNDPIEIFTEQNQLVGFRELAELPDSLMQVLTMSMQIFENWHNSLNEWHGIMYEEMWDGT